MAKESIVCDTDVIIDYWNTFNQRHTDTKLLIENEIGIENIAISTITKIELMIGAKDKMGLYRINKKCDHYQILLIDNEITQVAIELLQEYRLSHGLAMPDAFIAATCKVLDIKLFTHNVRDYVFIKGLRLYEP
jgi:predicted nucleic acid-binding protein